MPNGRAVQNCLPFLAEISMTVPGAARGCIMQGLLVWRRRSSRSWGLILQKGSHYAIKVPLQNTCWLFQMLAMWQTSHYRGEWTWPITEEWRPDPERVAVGAAKNRKTWRPKRKRRNHWFRRPQNKPCYKKKNQVPDDADGLCDRPQNVQGLNTAPESIQRFPEDDPRPKRWKFPHREPYGFCQRKASTSRAFSTWCKKRGILGDIHFLLLYCVCNKCPQMYCFGRNPRKEDSWIGNRWNVWIVNLSAYRYLHSERRNANEEVPVNDVGRILLFYDVKACWYGVSLSLLIPRIY